MPITRELLFWPPVHMAILPSSKCSPTCSEKKTHNVEIAGGQEETMARTIDSTDVLVFSSHRTFLKSCPKGAALAGGQQWPARSRAHTLHRGRRPCVLAPGRVRTPGLAAAPVRQAAASASPRATRRVHCPLSPSATLADHSGSATARRWARNPSVTTPAQHCPQGPGVTRPGWSLRPQVPNNHVGSQHT